MRMPAFWSHDGKRLPALLLAPIGWIYGRITLARMARRGAQLPIPVIAIGNFTVGGAGKTPTTLALAEALERRGERVFILSRGYGGTIAGPHRVDTATDNAAAVGDEPRMMAGRFPVIIARERAAGARLAVSQGASVLLLDDALQNPALAKDFTLAVVDGGFGFGNGFCVPAGPLRAPVRESLGHVDSALLIGADQTGAIAGLAGADCHAAAMQPDPAVAQALRGQRVLAFCGIGRPEKFGDTLRECGATVARLAAFADHHAFTEHEAESLTAEAARSGLLPVTTEKDVMRLTGGPAREKLRQAATILPVRVQLPEALLSRVYEALASSRSRVSTASGEE